MIGEAGRVWTIGGAVRDAVIQVPAAGADQFDFRVAGELNRLHTAVTEALAWLGLHTTRGKIAFENFGLLYRFNGTLVHDGWA